MYAVGRSGASGTAPLRRADSDSDTDDDFSRDREQAGNAASQHEWDEIDEAEFSVQFDMVAFEVFNKHQMKRFFASVWALIGVAVVYATVYLTNTAECHRHDTFDDAFHTYFVTECTANGQLPPNTTSHAEWARCCAPFDGVGNPACFPASFSSSSSSVSSSSWVGARTNATTFPAGPLPSEHRQPTYLGCCHMRLEGVLDVCASHCNFDLTDAIARTVLGCASVVGLFIYVVRFCRTPTMRRFEQKFVLGLFVLCVIMTNPFSGFFQLVRRIDAWTEGCNAARYNTRTDSEQSLDDLGSTIQSIGCTLFAATTFGFCIVFLMGYRSSSKFGEASTWQSAFKSARSLGPRYIAVMTLLSVYIAARVILSVLPEGDFASVSMGCVPVLAPLLSLLRLCAGDPVPDFARWYERLLNDSGVPNSTAFIGTCTQQPGTLVFISAILVLDAVLLWMFLNEARRTRRALLGLGYAQSRTTQVTFRFFTSHTVTIIVALQVLALAYALFLPPVVFWRSFVRDEPVHNGNLTSYAPLYLLGSTGSGNVGDATVMSFLACIWTFSLAFSYLPETAHRGFRGCFCDVRNYSRDHGAGGDKRADRDGFVTAKAQSTGRPVYKHSVAEAERSYFWARDNLRVGRAARRNGQLARPGMDRDHTRVVNIDDFSPGGAGTPSLPASHPRPGGAGASPGEGTPAASNAAPDRENVFVFETQLVLCLFAALAYECTRPPYFMPPLPPLPPGARPPRRSRHASLNAGSRTVSVSAPAGSAAARAALPAAPAAPGADGGGGGGAAAPGASVGARGGGGAAAEQTIGARGTSASISRAGTSGFGSRTASSESLAGHAPSPHPNTARLAGLFKSAQELLDGAAVARGYAKPPRFVTDADWVIEHAETDACVFVTEDNEDKCLIVAFRGTSTATNAMDDLKMNLVPFTMMDHLPRERQLAYPGVHIHAGFQRVYLSVREEVIALMQRLQQRRPRKVRVTGHSLGGALATLCAFDLATRVCHPRDVAVSTFGSPRVGNRAFANMFRDHVRCAWRVANQFDGVTRVPQACFGGALGPYAHVGKFVLVFANGDVVVDPSVIEKNFLHEFRIDYFRHKCTAYIIGLLNWDRRVKADAKRFANRRAHLARARRRLEMAQTNSSTNSSSSVMSSLGSINGSLRAIRSHRMSQSVAASRATTQGSVEVDLAVADGPSPHSLTQPLHARDFTLTPAQADVGSGSRNGGDDRLGGGDGAAGFGSDTSGFDGGSEGGSPRGHHNARGASGVAHRAGAGGSGAGGVEPRHRSPGGSMRDGFKVEQYLWASNCLREEYDQVGVEGLQGMYFMEPGVAAMIPRLFGARRRRPSARHSVDSAAAAAALNSLGFRLDTSTDGGDSSGADQ